MDRDDLDRLTWRRLVHLIKQADREVPPARKRPEYSDALIVQMYLWAVWHDRTMQWACQRRSYGTLFRPRRLPDESTFCRRRRSARCLAILQRVHELAADLKLCTPIMHLDSKPLVVGSCSKDRDARAGRICGGFARGYRLHALSTEDGRIPVWSMQPMNVDERPVARALLRYASGLDLVLADSNYDAGHLYDAVADRGGALFAPLRNPPNTPKAWKNNRRARLAALEAWEPWSVGGYVYNERLQVERNFGNVASFAGGLGPLPAWVRTWPRVCQWVGAKLIVYHARLTVRRGSAA